MALVQAKNFLTPFTNKVHLGTILLVALIFAIYRLSGGGAEVERNAPRTTPLATSVEHDPEIERFYREDAQQRFGAMPPNEAARPAKPRTNLLNEAFEERAARPRAAEAPATGGRRGLDDIEKQLGLR